MGLVYLCVQDITNTLRCQDRGRGQLANATGARYRVSLAPSEHPTTVRSSPLASTNSRIPRISQPGDRCLEGQRPSGSFLLPLALGLPLAFAGRDQVAYAREKRLRRHPLKPGQAREQDQLRAAFAQ
jgi:hypothetical protein